jgi:trehalose-phosphatase
VQPFPSQNRWQPVEAFFASLSQATASASTPVLALDYDGTLAPFHIDRSLALPYPGVQGWLGRIQAETPTHLVLISGRPAGEVRSLLALEPAPEIWGAHGLQRLWPDGRLETGTLDAGEERVLRQALQALDAMGWQPLAEVKPGSVALHTRGLPPAEAQRIQQAVHVAWQPLAAQLGPPLLEFDGGIELRSSRQNKGDALRTILAEQKPGTPIAYLGDDATDEDAFLALRSHTPALSVLVRPEWRATHAQTWLRPPDELMQFLEAWLQHTS